VIDTATWTDHLGLDHSDALANLVAGLTDHASANRLGVSERTVQRRIRDLMDWSDSGNRMQLGHRAALAGLPPPYRRRPDPPAAPTPDAAGMHLLRLLLADIAADRTLNMSASSVERRVRDLMQLAGARSRAQLGWRATRWGWL
jgi:DNA-binding NarL/FixJ family response regulator